MLRICVVAALLMAALVVLPAAMASAQANGDLGSLLVWSLNRGRALAGAYNLMEAFGDGLSPLGRDFQPVGPRRSPSSEPTPTAGGGRNRSLCNMKML